MSKMECGNFNNFRSWVCKLKKHKRILWALAIFIILILVMILIISLVLHATKPKYYLRDVIIYNLNFTGQTSLTTTMQVTLICDNPNYNIGIYYDKLDVYAMYQGQHITVPTELPPLYENHGDLNYWSLYLNGTDLPLERVVYYGLNNCIDEMAGNLTINVHIDGRLRWKVGSWIYGHYHIHVNCPASIEVKSDGANGHKFQFYHNHLECDVDV